MNIYESEGTDVIVDLRAAAAELRAAGSITSESARRAVIAEINTATLLDIALSLRVVAAEARAAMPSPPTEADALTADDRETPEDFVVEGDLVAVDGLDDPAQVVGFGQSEGAIYAKIKLIDGTETRAWLESLTRLVGDELGVDAMQDASEVDAAGADGETVEPADLVDDIDADFDGGQHPAAATALDVLKANEAERKAAKKAGSKKGSKK